MHLNKMETEGVLERLDKCVATLAEMKKVYKHRKLLGDLETRINELKRSLRLLKIADTEQLNKQKTYNETLIELIEQLKKIEELFNKGHYIECRNLIDLCIITLDNLDVVDDNTQLLRRHFDAWEEKAKTEL